MGFATDFAEHADRLSSNLQAERAAVIDAVFEISMRAQQQGWIVSADDNRRLADLRAQEAVLDAEILRLRNLTVSYHSREREARIQAQNLKRQSTKKRNHERRMAMIAQPRSMVNIFTSDPIWASSLEGAAPPWQWSSVRGVGFTSFSDMRPIPGFHWVEWDGNI